MKIENFLINIKDNKVIKEVLNYLSIIEDNRLNECLLKELILKYAALEKKVSKLNYELLEKERRLDEDLMAAAEIQQSLLPKEIRHIENIKFSFKFKPSERIGGDIFNLFPLDKEHLGVYMLDVSGHGVPAALVSVSVSQMIKPYDFYNPKELLTKLDKEYPIERFDKFFTIIYFVLNIYSGDLIYSNAAHPHPVLIRTNGNLEFLDKGGTVIGMSGIMPFEEETKKLYKGDKLILYTDGVVEYQNKEGKQFGDNRFHDLLKQYKEESIDEILMKIYDEIINFGNEAKLQDDISMLGFEFQGG
ncbi:MAG: serine/threonine-protein phosphatase [Desulfobacterales bacterium]|nr:serine/threonine-protein phosphatase [Desulfobacterales bacterium]